MTQVYFFLKWKGFNAMIFKSSYLWIVILLRKSNTSSSEDQDMVAYYCFWDVGKVWAAARKTDLLRDDMSVPVTKVCPID